MPEQMKPRIGDWVRRVYAPGTYEKVDSKPHRVDSTTVTGVFTRCGKFMPHQTKTRSLSHWEIYRAVDAFDYGACKSCGATQ